MGQYYQPSILDESGKKVLAHFNSHEYNNGLKLMEHSWLDNELVAAVEAMLELDGPARVVWAGDYADPEPDTGEPLFGSGPAKPVRFSGAKGFNEASYIEKVSANAKLPVEVTTATHPFIINVDKQVYVDKRDVPKDEWGQIHPLPLLTVEGNGRGGGDYRGAWPHVGTWARDHIMVSATEPEHFAKLDVSGLVE